MLEHIQDRLRDSHRLNSLTPRSLIVIKQESNGRRCCRMKKEEQQVNKQVGNKETRIVTSATTRDWSTDIDDHVRMSAFITLTG